MAKVVLQAQVANDFTNGETEIEVDAHNVRALLWALEAAYPGLGDRLSDKTAVAIDGEIFQEPLLEPIQPTSEVYFLPMIEGG